MEKNKSIDHNADRYLYTYIYISYNTILLMYEEYTLIKLNNVINPNNFLSENLK